MLCKIDERRYIDNLLGYHLNFNNKQLRHPCHITHFMNLCHYDFIMNTYVTLSLPYHKDCSFLGCSTESVVRLCNSVPYAAMG